MKDLRHLFDRDAVFSEESLIVNDYLRDSSELELNATSYWYIGLYKPFREIYFEGSAFNLSGNPISVKYYDGASYVDVPDLIDDTKDFQRSGKLSWSFESLTDPNNQQTTDFWKQDTQNSETAYFIRIEAPLGVRSSLLATSETGNSASVFNIVDAEIGNFSVGQRIYVPAENVYRTVSAVDVTMGAANITVSVPLAAPLPDNAELYSLMSIQGMNIVYADDTQLLSEVRVMNDFLAEGDSSFIAYHVAARDEIVQTLRNGGNVKQLTNDTFLPGSSIQGIKRIQMSKWDILDIGEISQAAKYLALSKVFFDVSENVEDKAYQRYRDYEGSYGAAFKLFYMSLDFDDDGNIDEQERLALNDVTVNKV